MAAKRPVKRRGTVKKTLSKPQASRRRDIITKDMPLHEVLQVHPETLKVFVAYDMTCLGDEEQHAMNIQSWALEHGIEVSLLLRQLNGSARRRHSLARKSPSHKGL